LIALQWLTHGTYVTNVLAGNSSVFDLAQWQNYVLNFTILHAVVLVLAAWELVDRIRRRCWSAWVVYAPISLVLALGTIGKTGAGESYFLAPIAAASILAALRINALINRRHAVAWLAAALAVQALLLAHAPVSDLVPWLPDRGPQAAALGHAPSVSDLDAANRLVGLMRRVQGPVLAEDASFAVVAGKPLVGATPPSLRNLYHAGLWDPTPLVTDLQAHRYAIVVLNAELYPEPVLSAIGQSYFQDHSVRLNSSTYRVFLPGSS
jgi:hypothetical protein